MAQDELEKAKGLDRIMDTRRRMNEILGFLEHGDVERGHAISLIIQHVEPLLAQAHAAGMREGRIAELNRLQPELFTDAGAMDAFDVDDYLSARLANLTAKGENETK